VSETSAGGCGCPPTAASATGGAVHHGANERAHVDALHRELLAHGATILDPPREYPEYVSGYYAVFFADPDGMKLELVHIPG